MHADFWHEKWEKGEIAFHNKHVHPMLVAHFPLLGLQAGKRILLPLCGKTVDIDWLLLHGLQVVGIELSELAVKALFARLKLSPDVTQLAGFRLYQAPNLHVFVGDFFAITSDLLGKVDAVYDRAALVALPASIGEKYAAHLVKICQGAPQLLITFDYQQSQLAGPPFAVSKIMLDDYYAEHYAMSFVVSAEVAGGLKGKVAATENVWLLNQHDSTCLNLVVGKHGE
jgi:thiopurine S-methyltransferase